MSAPVLDPGDLSRSAAPLAQARTLPAAAYHDGDVFAWEQHTLIPGSWVCVGRSEDLRRSGDRRALTIGVEPVVVTRASDGVLHGLSNVCRHRGHEVVPLGDSAAATIRCPYHAWTYGLDGRFRGGPRLRDMPEFDRADPDHALVALPVLEWCGWVFVAATPDPPAFAAWIDGLDEVLASYPLERLRSGVTHEYEVAANWKLLVENYHECYHCDEIHPELCRVSSPRSGTDMRPRGAWRGGTMELLDGAETMSLDGRSGGMVMPGVDPALRTTVWYVSVFPNLLLSVHPDYVMTHRITPLTPERTVVSCSWLFSPEVLARDGFDPSYAVEFWDITNRQDWAACEGVQRSVRGLGYRQGPFTADEGSVHRFVQQVANAYLVGASAAVLADPAR